MSLSVKVYRCPAETLNQRLAIRLLTLNAKASATTVGRDPGVDRRVS